VRRYTGRLTLGVDMTSGRYAGGARSLRSRHRGGHSAVARANRGRRFLFHRPIFTLGIHGGFDRAIAGGDVFTFVTKELTLDRAISAPPVRNQPRPPSLTFQ